MSRTAFSAVTFTGPAVDDAAMLERLPGDLRRLLLSRNGFIAFNGGLHVRGACRAPDWHALATAWDGPQAFHRLYPAVRPSDIPFAQDCIGYQFLLRDGQVVMLDGEVGDVKELGCDLPGFLDRCVGDPDAVLGLAPLTRFRADGSTLEPGQLLGVWPPYCTSESAQGVTLRAIPVGERLAVLADLASRIGGLHDGDRFAVDWNADRD